MKTNNYIKYTAFIIVFISGITCAIAQVPGFMGKKITLSAGAYLGFSLGAPVNTKSTDAGLEKKFYLGADYVISRKWTTGIEYHRLNTGLELNFDRPSEQISRFDYTYALKANTFKFYFTRFGSRSNFLAPVGRYFTLGLLVINYKVTDEEGYLFAPGRDLFKGSTMGFTLDIGKKRVFYKQLVLDYCLQTGLVFPKSNGENTLASEFASEAGDRLLTAYAINFKLGLGWLL